MKIREEAYQYYFYLVQERMNIFWNRYEGKTTRLTNDNIFSRHKFTNVYRALDRVSQYLIRNVIYNEQQRFENKDILLRIIVFKIFNNIDTWEFLESRVGKIRVDNFDVERISKLLAQRIKEKPIFNAAYMMTGSHSKYNHLTSKHEKWLTMVKVEMLQEGRFDKIEKATSLEEVFNILRSASFIGDFLAYQYSIDFNYSEVINFDENSFVKAGIGAIRGIKKCFYYSNKYSFEDYIEFTQKNFNELQKKYGFTDFKNLFGREPTLIDLQNCFCETDKYLRVKMPELAIDNTRIKQKFTTPKQSIEFFFPPKWGLNKNLKSWNTQNLKGSTLF
jgi:hypothetical protein